MKKKTVVALIGGVLELLGAIGSLIGLVVGALPDKKDGDSNEN